MRGGNEGRGKGEDAIRFSGIYNLWTHGLGRPRPPCGVRRSGTPGRIGEVPGSAGNPAYIRRTPRLRSELMDAPSSSLGTAKEYKSGRDPPSPTLLTIAMSGTSNTQNKTASSASIGTKLKCVRFRANGAN